MQQERAGENMTEDTTPKRRPHRRKEVAALPEDAFAIENPDSEPDEESAAG